MYSALAEAIIYRGLMFLISLTSTLPNVKFHALREARLSENKIQGTTEETKEKTIVEGEES